MFIKCGNLFSVRSTDNAVRFASEARISLIANPYDCAVETVDYMLEEYFSHPRYLHVNDVININMDEYAKDRIYSSGSPAKPKLYFTVNSLKLDNHDTRYSVDSCYVVRGISTLIQEAQVHNYIPHKIVNTGDRFPSVLAEPFYHLISCIVPFIQKGKKNNHSLARVYFGDFLSIYDIWISQSHRANITLFFFLSRVVRRYPVGRKADISSERAARLR